MARASRSTPTGFKQLQQEIKSHQEELSKIEADQAAHQRETARGQAKAEYLQQLIKTNQAMIARLGKLAAPEPPARPRRRPGRPAKVAKPTRRPRRGRPPRVVAPAEGKPAPEGLAALTVPDAVEQVLKAAGRPVHLREITARLIAGGKAFRTKKPEVSVLTIIRKDMRFRNMGRNMWTLG